MSGTSVPAHGIDRRTLFRGAVLLGVAGAGLAATSATATRPAAAAVEPPTIHSAADWGARPPSRDIELFPRPNKILIHHTATQNVEDYSQERAYALAKAIQNSHMDTQGWPDSGQHFTVSRGAYLLEGRNRSLELLEAGEQLIQGTHCPGQNDQSIGIENEGTYTDVDLRQEHWDSLVTLCAYICQQYEIPATELYGHRDFYNTQCPGDVLYGRLDELKDAVGQAIG